MIYRTPYPGDILINKVPVINSKKANPDDGWHIVLTLNFPCKKRDEAIISIELLIKNESLRKKEKPVRTATKIEVGVNNIFKEIAPPFGDNIDPLQHYARHTRMSFYLAETTGEHIIKLYVKAACTSSTKSDYVAFGDQTSIQVKV